MSQWPQNLRRTVSESDNKMVMHVYVNVYGCAKEHPQLFEKEDGEKSRTYRSKNEA